MNRQLLILVVVLVVVAAAFLIAFYSGVLSERPMP